MNRKSGLLAAACITLVIIAAMLWIRNQATSTVSASQVRQQSIQQADAQPSFADDQFGKPAVGVNGTAAGESFYEDRYMQSIPRPVVVRPEEPGQRRFARFAIRNVLFRMHSR